jgi:hypothetical protein
MEGLKISAGVSLDDLPPEINKIILNQLTKCRRDLASCRSLNRVFEVLTRPMLFEVIHVKATFRSLRNLLRVCYGQPRMNQFENTDTRRFRLELEVKEVIFHVTDCNEKTWNPYVQAALADYCHPCANRNEFLWNNYKDIDDRYFAFQRSLWYKDMLMAALCRLESLHTMRIIHSVQNVAEFPWDYEDSLEDPEMNSRHHLQRLSLRSLHGDRGELDSLAVFSTLMNAAWSTSFFSKLELKCFTNSGGIGQDLFHDHVTVTRAATLFKNLKILELQFSCEVWYDDDSHMQQSPLFNLISQATKLERLKLNGLFRTCVSADITCYIGPPTFVWKFLKDVHLEGFGFTQVEINGFLRNHKGTLKNVALWRCALFEGTWPDVMRVIRHDDLRLEWFSLYSTLAEVDLSKGEYVYTQEQNETMVRYVYGKEDLLPTSGDAQWWPIL